MKNRIRLKRLFSLILILILIFVLSSTAVFAGDISKNIKGTTLYKVSCDNPLWKSFETTDEMRAAVNIDIEAFSSLSTEEVLRAVLEYPLIGDILLYNNNKEGIEAVSKHCTALDVFLERKDSYKVLMQAIADTDATKEMLIAPTVSKNIVPSILKELAAYLTAERHNNFSPTRSSAYVYTPNGTAVFVTTYSELSPDEISSYNDYCTSTYPNAQYVSTATRKYNCHSYAWYWNSTSNSYWMDDPWAYMHDGSYTSVSTPSTAHKAFYSDNHSANIYDATGNSYSNTYVISKWGQGSLMIHKINYGPYGGTITLWKR